MSDHRVPLYAVVISLALTTVALAEIQWVSRGADDAHIVAHVQDDFGGLVLIGTEFGYRVNAGPSTWVAYEEPGVPGRAVHAAAEMYTPGGVITGRVDAAGHGYLEHNTNSAQGQVIYSSTCGAFVDVVGWGIDHLDSVLWACSRAGDTPGELVLSRDRGQTWQVITGHGQQDLYDLVLFPYWDRIGLYVAGDAGIVYSDDEGATWHDLTPGLPGTEVRALWDPSGAVGVPGKSRLQVDIYACTDAGLIGGVHDTAVGSCTWYAVPLIADPVREVGFFNYGFTHGSIALTDDDRILVNHRGTGWQDVTGSLAGLEIVGVQASLLVATANDGTWYLDGLLTAVGDQPPRRSLALSAAPNPFNPATTLRYEIPHAGPARLSIYDLAGRHVETVFDRVVPAGAGEVDWRPQGLSSGVYLVRLAAGAHETVTRVVLAR